MTALEKKFNEWVNDGTSNPRLTEHELGVLVALLQADRNAWIYNANQLQKQVNFLLKTPAPTE